MTLRINHNVAALSAHRSLLNNQSGLSRTLEKLSSGLKINRAADGPATLVISEQMRAQIAGITQAIDNSEGAISMAQTTEANLSEVSRLLVSMRQLAIHASNEGVNDQSMLEADQRELSNALNSIDRIASQAQFGQTKLLDGSHGALGQATGGQLEFVSAGVKAQGSDDSGFEVRLSQNAAQASVVGTQALTDEMIQAGETLMITEEGKTARYQAQAGDSREQVMMNLAADAERNGLKVTVQMDKVGRLSVRHQEWGSAPSFQAFSTSAGVLSQEGGVIEAAQAGQDVKGWINGESAIGQGQHLTGVSGAQNVDGLTVKIKGLVGQPGAVLPPEGQEVGRVYLTQNSLKFQVGGNQNQSVSLNIGDIHSRRLASGMENNSRFANLSEVDLTDFQGAQDALLLIDQAVNQVTSLRGELGAFQKNTLESNLNNLRVAAENLVSSESVLRDVDMAQEMAEFTRHQIMSESATAMLAQANQMPNQVLQLLS